ncbi:MAG TPA: hypothetical protein VFM64_02255, partial [Candidatus Nitrosotenuis sp.]|nr:hypothetical protein [Candidatus Nitrosotenuis sp.]
MSVVLIACLCFGGAFADSGNLEVKILQGSSDQDQHIKSFYPPILPITQDNSITWVNDDSVAHSITSGIPTHPDYSGKFFKTGIIEPG